MSVLIALEIGSEFYSEHFLQSAQISVINYNTKEKLSNCQLPVRLTLFVLLHVKIQPKITELNESFYFSNFVSQQRKALCIINIGHNLCLQIHLFRIKNNWVFVQVHLVQLTFLTFVAPARPFFFQTSPFFLALHLFRHQISFCYSALYFNACFVCLQIVYLLGAFHYVLKRSKFISIF